MADNRLAKFLGIDNESSIKNDNEERQRDVCDRQSSLGPVQGDFTVAANMAISIPS